MAIPVPSARVMDRFLRSYHFGLRYNSPDGNVNFMAPLNRNFIPCFHNKVFRADNIVLTTPSERNALADGKCIAKRRKPCQHVINSVHTTFNFVFAEIPPKNSYKRIFYSWTFYNRVLSFEGFTLAILNQIKVPLKILALKTLLVHRLPKIIRLERRCIFLIRYKPNFCPFFLSF